MSYYARLAISSRGRRQDRDESGEGSLRSQGGMEGALGTVLELLLEQQRVQQEQQQVLMALLEQPQTQQIMFGILSAVSQRYDHLATCTLICIFLIVAQKINTVINASHSHVLLIGFNSMACTYRYTL